MSLKWFNILALTAAATLLFSLSSCAYNQHLESIQVQPSIGGTFGAADPALFFDFKAYGTYIHPPQTKDITDLVTWQTDNPQVVQVSSAGVVSPNLGCGVGDITATFKDGSNLVVSSSVPVTVDGPASSGCTPAGPEPILTVTVAGTLTGTVTSAPAGITCSTGSSCSSQFTTGTSVSLTAAPASSFQSWSGCNATNGASCTVFLENSTTVTATFN
jgi:hypothetical protein